MTEFKKTYISDVDIEALIAKMAKNNIKFIDGLILVLLGIAIGAVGLLIWIISIDTVAFYFIVNRF